MRRRILAVAAALWLGMVQTHVQADGINQTIPLGSGVLNALGTATGSLGAPVVNNGSWADPISNFNASGLNTTTNGSIASGSTTVALGIPSNFVPGANIQVVGAGVSAANLNTTVATVPTYTYVATTGTTTTGGTSTTLTVGSVAGWVAGMGIAIPGALGQFTTLLTTVTVVGATTLTLAQGATAVVTGVPVSSVNTLTLAAAASTSVQGVTVRETGTIIAPTATLTLGSTVGWKAGEGICVNGAGAAAAVLCTTVLSVASGTVLTLAANATTTATAQPVNYDDTVAINAALATQKNVALAGGVYNVTAQILLQFGQILQCAGSGITNIINRGTTNNTIAMTVGSDYVNDCNILQAPDVTPSAGYGVIWGPGTSNISAEISQGGLQRDIISGTWGGIDINGFVSHGLILNTVINGFAATNTMVTINDPQPAGDMKWIGVGLNCDTGAPMNGMVITSSDSTIYTNLDIVGCDPQLTMLTGNSLNQYFVGGSIEGNPGAEVNPLVQIGSSANGILITGTEFAADNGHGSVAISGTANHINISSNILLPNVTGSITNTSSGTDITVANNNAGGSPGSIETHSAASGSGGTRTTSSYFFDVGTVSDNDFTLNAPTGQLDNLNFSVNNVLQWVFTDDLGTILFNDVTTGTFPLIIGPSLVTVPQLAVSAASPVISACGTGTPSVLAGSSPSGGQFTMGTGAPTACTMTFATAYNTAAFCTVTPAGGTAYAGTYRLSASSKAAFTLTLGTGTSSLVWTYTCAGN